MNYYPPPLVDWFMDNWISFVYGKKRTFKALNVEVFHEMSAHGTRYEFNRSNEKILGNLIEEGRKKIRLWMLKHSQDITNTDLKEFDNDEYKAGFMHIDSPKSAYKI